MRSVLDDTVFTDADTGHRDDDDTSQVVVSLRYSNIQTKIASRSLHVSRLVLPLVFVVDNKDKNGEWIAIDVCIPHEKNVEHRADHGSQLQCRLSPEGTKDWI